MRSWSKKITLPSMDRRSLLKTASALLGATLLGRTAFAEGLPKPENAIKPQESLKRLLEGNRRYVANTPQPNDYASTREALTKGQNPFACVLSCADSRVSPEHCFDAERGDLFVTRVAGNYVTPEILASLEYGVAVLQSPLIMVLGHTSCGAISAAIKSYTKDEDFPGHIQKLATDLSPAVRAAQKNDPANLELASIKENILINVNRLQNSTPILRKQVQQGKLIVVGGVYNLDTGSVTLL